MKKNIAVVGCGYWGKNLVRNFSDLGVLNSICDPNVQVASKYAEQYKVRKCSFNEILRDTNIKGVVLAVPADVHAPMAIEVMNASKHVFVEKPLAMNENEAELMIETAKKNNVMLMVGHLLRFHPVFKKLCNLVSINKIGGLNYIYSNRLSFGKVRSHEDVIWSFAPHDISMILALTGEEPISVSTNAMSILQKKIIDTATIHMQFGSGLKSKISVSWLHPYKEHKLVVVGKSAIIVFDDNKPWKEKLALYPYKTSTSEGLIDIKKLDVEYIEVFEEEPLKIECQHFIDVVNKNNKALTDGKEGLSVIKVLAAATQSYIENILVKL